MGKNLIECDCSWNLLLNAVPTILCLARWPELVVFQEIQKYTELTISPYDFATFILVILGAFGLDQYMVELTCASGLLHIG